jgi:uncharacterized protein (TIRG00374 family)
LKRPGKAVQVIAGILITAAAMYVFLRGTDASRLLSELGRINPWSIAACLGLTVVAMVLRTWRWNVLLPDSEGSHKRNLFSHTIIGFMINNVVPARAGEAVRVMLLWRKNKYPLAVSAGSLILDRAVDTMVILVIFACPALTIKSLVHLKTAGFAAAGIFAVSCIALAAFGLRPGIISFIVSRGAFFFPKKFRQRIEAIGRDATSVVGWIRSPLKVFLVFLLSAGVWACSVAAVMILARAYAPLSFWQGAFIVSFAAAGAAIPLAPGFVGTLHAAVLQGFLLLGWDAEAGRAMALLIHASGYLPVTLIGFIYFLRADMSFKEISNAGEIIKQ